MIHLPVGIDLEIPDVVRAEYTLRAANYLLGTHPLSSESYMAAIVTDSRKHTYSNNRGDYSYLPGRSPQRVAGCWWPT